MSTLDYYEQNSQSYIEATFKVDMSTAYQLFERYLPPHAVILDLGCGSGRDALYFKQKYEVLAVDPVMEFVQHAQALGLNAKCLKAQEMSFHDAFDGIFACSSLLHISSQELPGVFHKCHEALKEGGILYASFKYGDFEGMMGERYFTYLTETSVMPYLDDFTVLDIVITKDQLANREIRWLNIVVRKN